MMPWEDCLAVLVSPRRLMLMGLMRKWGKWSTNPGSWGLVKRVTASEEEC